MEYQDSVGQVIRPSVKFRVGRLSSDSIEDLPKLGRRSSNFTINLEMEDRLRLGDGRLQITKYGTSWDIHPRDQVWTVYGGLREIFERRECRWKNDLHKAPMWAFLICLFAALISLEYLLFRSYHRPIVTVSPFEWSAVVALYFASGVLGFGRLFGHSVVEFRNSYDQVPGWRQKVGSKLGYFVAALIGALVTKLADRLIHWIWP